MTEPLSFIDHPLVQLTLVPFREFWREPQSVFWALLFPPLLAAGLALAFRNKPADLARIGVTDPEYAILLAQDHSLQVLTLDKAAGEEALRKGRISLLAIPGSPGSITYRYDDTNPDAQMARLVADRAVQRAAGSRDLVTVHEELVREPGSRYIDFLVPGLIGMNLMGGGMWGVGFVIVDARRRNLLKRLAVSPMPRGQYLMSFLISRVGLLVTEVSAMLAFGVLFFHIPVRGPLWELALFGLLGLLAFSSIGLLIGSRMNTVEAASRVLNLVMFPMWVLSGVFFSVDRFPHSLQSFIHLLPLTAIVDGLRANMLQGARLTQLGTEILILSGWLVACFVVAHRFFRWR